MFCCREPARQVVVVLLVLQLKLLLLLVVVAGSYDRDRRSSQLGSN